MTNVLLERCTSPYCLNVQANEIFLGLPEPSIASLESKGFRFYRWETPEGEKGPSIRLVTAFDTKPESVDAFIAAARAPGSL